MACCLSVVGLLDKKNDDRRLWFWYSCVPGSALTIFWLYYLLRLPKFRVGCYLASIWPPSRSGNLSIRGPSSGGIIRTSEKTKELYVCMHIKQGRDKNGRFQVMQVRSSLVCVMISRTTQTI
ncbi:hypothetical protein HID58_041833 [Brassica napus]|uniref:(rape) hypothetical protein n=1 Tax=Brassica napus TaxID=3708 RepID=A0A816RLZ1_BRANA|nr:hypothetical protein HID58_041833 [Brassica napus]CAF2071918.1 unnamed protein product [Brassica napus]